MSLPKTLELLLESIRSMNRYLAFKDIRKGDNNNYESFDVIAQDAIYTVTSFETLTKFKFFGHYVMENDTEPIFINNVLPDLLNRFKALIIILKVNHNGRHGFILIEYQGKYYKIHSVRNLIPLEIKELSRVEITQLFVDLKTLKKNANEGLFHKVSCTKIAINVNDVIDPVIIFTEEAVII